MRFDGRVVLRVRQVCAKETGGGSDPSFTFKIIPEAILSRHWQVPRSSQGQPTAAARQVLVPVLSGGGAACPSDPTRCVTNVAFPPMLSFFFFRPTGLSFFHFHPTGHFEIIHEITSGCYNKI